MTTLVGQVPVAAIEAELARKSLPDFVRFAWRLVEPGTKLEWNWHLDELCDVLEAVTRGEKDRVVINVPPGTMKSLLVSVLWPAWEWATDPGLRYLTASYSSDLTIRDNRRLRSIVASEWYQDHYTLRLAGDQKAKIRFDTAQRGWRVASSVSGGFTGEHPDRIIIDDPIKATEARSEAALKGAVEFYRGTVSTRLARDPAVILIMQRLHEEDLSGFLLRMEGWEHVMFPMRFDPDRADPRDHRTEAGALLWPDGLWPEQKVRGEELELGPYGAAGQLQQRPAPEGGGLFQRDWFDTVDAAPTDALRCRGWDTAATEGAGDWTAGVKIAYSEGEFFIEHVWRDQLGPSRVDKAIKTLATIDGKSCRIREEQEPGSSGKTVIAARTRALVGYDYKGVPTTGDKVTRARPFRAQCEAGNVKLVKGEWNTRYLDELCVFPMGSHDDQVDASSAAFNELATGHTGQIRVREVIW